jgi:hypothetical protein
VTVDAHPAPLEPRWLGAVDAAHRAGVTTVTTVRLRNAGSATWRSRGAAGLQVAYHWLDPLGNPIVWDGRRTALPAPVPPGAELQLEVAVTAPRPPGAYVLRFDLVEEHRFWLAELGCATLDVEVTVEPRIAERRRAGVVHGGADPQTEAALAAQEEALVTDDPVAVAHLVAGAVPAPDWSRRMLDAHAEGWAAAGPAVVRRPGGWPARRGAARRLAAWGPGGRNPRFDGPLLLPSLLAGLEPGEHGGLPSYEGPDALFDGRVTVTLPPRSGRRPT